jgi:polyisoprenoid-binding protein YceI
MATQTQSQTTIPAGRWSSDRIHSSATFEVGHLGISTFSGRVKDFDAKLNATDDGFELEGAANVETLDIDEENLRAHLLSPEFFDVERYPQIRFRTDGVSEDADGLVVIGELEIKGIAKRVEARGRVGELGVDASGGDRIGLELETVIDRTEFGLNWNMELPNGEPALANDVRLVVSLELVREEA